MKKGRQQGFSTNVGGWEKASYGLYFFGQNIFYGLIALNVHTMFSDVGITAASIAVILLVTRVWDAVNDPLFGVVIDKVRFKGGGRFLPWIRISLPFIALTSIIMFALPVGLTPALKITWAIVAYVAWDMSYTLCDVPIFVLPTSMTDNIKERTGILTIGRYLGTFGVMLAMLALPMVQARLGWMVTGLAYSILGTLFMLPACFSIKERHIVRPEKEVKLREMVSYVAGNKYLITFYIGMFISYITNFAVALMIFFPRYNLGDQDLGTVMMMAMMLPMLVVGAFIPAITKRIDKFPLFFFGHLAGAVIFIIRYFAGYENFGLFMTLAVFQGIAAAFTGILVFMFTPDCLEYGTYHTGERAEGAAASVQTFFVKLTGSLSGPLAMLLLSAFGFIEGDVAVQPASALQGIWLCMTVFPAVGVVFALFIWSRYKLRDKDVQIMAEYNNGRISKEEADAQLASKYGPAADLTKMTITTLDE